MISELTKQRARVLRERFGFETFTIREASEALGSSRFVAKSVVSALRQLNLLRRGRQRRSNGGNIDHFAFLTEEQLQSGKNYDWEEPMDYGEEGDPTNGVVTLDLQLFGEELDRYRAVREKIFNKPYSA